MKLKNIYLALESEDFTDKNIVSDFNFQTDFITHFIEKKIVAKKFETSNFQTLMIRGRKSPSDKLVLKEHFKALEVEFSFDEKKYNEIYPYSNTYPLDGLLKPVKNENDFNNFLFEIILNSFEKSKTLNTEIPSDYLIEILNEFKLNNFKNEWLFKSKIFKEQSIKASLFCKLTCNYFSLELIIEKNKKEILKKEILKTLPNAIMYKYEFKDIVIENNILKVIKDDYDKSTLYKLQLSDINN
jgi:hypothetical protein